MHLAPALVALALTGAAPGPSPQEAEQTPTRAELERAFARKMAGARLVGHFVDDSQPDAVPQAETYTLGHVGKTAQDRWGFEAKIEFGDKSVSVPLVFDVLWAGDTPVITLTDRKIPMLGTYTARVMVYGDRYVGIWSGDDHGGTMYGRIERGEVGPSGGDEKYVHWPSFRGFRARGQAEGFSTVEEWDVPQGKNVLWKLPIEGLAHSSPVVWGDKIFLTSAVRLNGPAELKVGLYGSIVPVEDDSMFTFNVICIDKTMQMQVWAMPAFMGVPKIKRHPKGSHAAPTPAVDATHVVAFFGSEGLHCFDHMGMLKWQKDLGVLDSGYYTMPAAQWGFGSSPVIHEGKVYVQCDVQGQSFLAAFDVETGQEVWRTNRDEVPTWSSPTVDVRAGRSQIICNGYLRIAGYDLATGKELWWIGGAGGDIPVPTPIVAHDTVYITNAHGRNAPIYAIDVDAEGELGVHDKHMVWSEYKTGNYMQTPLVYEDLLFLCSDSGILSCRDAATGKLYYRERLGSGRSGFTASLVATDGKIYATSEEGEVYVVPAVPEFEVISVNPMGETCMATPAIAGGVMYWRTRGNLVAIGKP